MTKKMKDSLPSELLPVKVAPEMFSFMVELDQAESGTGDPHPGRHYTTVEQIRAKVPTNGTRVWTWFDKEKLDRAAEGGRFVIVDLWLASVQTMRHAKVDGYTDFQKYLDERVQMVRDLQKKWGERVWFCICGEQDNGIKWPETQFKSKKEGYEFFMNAHLTDFNPYEPDKGYEPASTRKMADVPMMRNRYGFKDLKQEPVAFQIAMCVCAHYPYEWGAGFVWMERNCWLANTQIGISFMRGAGSQYKSIWGLDYSSWGDPTSRTCHFDEDGKRKGGMSESLLLREWITSFYSGSNSLLAESSASCAWMPDKKKKGSFKLSPYGINCKKFGEHTLVKHPDRGTPVVPVALMLEQYHGWDPRDHRIWGGACPYGRGEEMLDNFYNMAFPGQERGFYHDEWRKPGQKPQFPYEHNMECARKAMEEGVDTRPLEKGMLVPSVWGDSFDVVLENCPLDVLKKYPILVLLGAIKVSPELRANLDEYVRTGGILVLNSEHTSEEDDKWLGISCDRTKMKMGCNYTFLPTGKSYDLGFGYFRGIEIKSDDVEPVISNPWDKSGTSAIRRKMGNGYAYFISMPYMQSKPNWPIAPPCQALMDHLIRQHLPADVQGEKLVQFLMNKTNDGLIVTIINNEEEKWKGEIVLLDNSYTAKGAMELWQDKELKSERKDRLEVKVSPFEFMIVKFPNEQ